MKNIKFPTLRRIYPSSIAKQIVSIQPTIKNANGESEYWIDGLPYEVEEFNKLTGKNYE